MSDLFVLNYLLQTLQKEAGAGDWSLFKRKQREGIDLSQADLENRNLRGYDLSHCNLSAARFYNAILSGADLTGSQLSYADLRRADLANSYMPETDLSGANLEGANGIDTDFTNARLCGCKLSGAHLAGANFAGADLENASFRGATLKFANFLGARIKRVDVEEADLTGCRFDPEAEAHLRHADRALRSGESKPRRRERRPSSAAKDDPYKILEVEKGAPEGAIAKAYRKKVMQYHPDKVRHLGEKLQELAREEFEKVQNAYKALTDEPPRSGSDSPSQAAPPKPSKPRREPTLHELLQLAKAHPNNDRVHYNLGLKFFDEGMLDNAIESYERAIQLNPGNKAAEHNLKIARLTQTLKATQS